MSGWAPETCRVVLPDLVERPRVLQVHPTRQCNLRCLHCYSSSGPGEGAALDADLVRRVVDDAAALGYRTLSLSGGEPFLYRDLAAVLRHAREAGMRTAVVTNGTLFGGGRLDAVAGLVDRLVVSIDGRPELHNRVRAAPWAFDRMAEGLALVREAGLPFGLLATVTNESWPHLACVARFAVDQGAVLLQLHAVEGVGRAAEAMSDDVPDGAVLAATYVIAAALRDDHAGRLFVHADLVHRMHIEELPELVYAGDDDAVDPLGDPAGAVGVLVVEDDGVVVPFGYGLGRRFAVADLRRERLADAWPRFAATRHRPLRALCRRVHADLLASEQSVFAWHDALGRASLEPGEAAGAGLRWRA